MRKNKVIKGLVITAGVIAALAIGGSIVTGGVISDKILHQNEGKNTCENSLKQLELAALTLSSLLARVLTRA